MRRTTFAPPLSSAVTYILLSIAERDLHGYGIMQETRRLSGGEYKLGPGTLYDNLRGLLAEGLVSDFEEDKAGEAPRRMYSLTQAGAGVLARELSRLAEVVKAGRERLATGLAKSAR